MSYSVNLKNKIIPVIHLGGTDGSTLARKPGYPGSNRGPGENFYFELTIVLL